VSGVPPIARAPYEPSAPHDRHRAAVGPGTSERQDVAVDPSPNGSPAGGSVEPREIVLELAFVLGRLAVIGLLAIGASGLVAWAMGAAFGTAFVAGDAPGVTYTPDRCADLSEYAPGARTCEAAAASHHFDETVTYRVAVGVAGLAGLGAYAASRRSLRRRHRARRNGKDMATSGRRRSALPEGFEATVGTVAFGLVGLGLVALAASLVALGPHAGAGAPLSAGLVALAVAVPFGISLWRVLARRPTHG
jgi:hypothetical protein